MVGGRRALVAVLATTSAVLALGQSSSGVEIASAPHALPLAADFPASAGTTTRTSSDAAGNEAGGSQPMISANGRWQVFSSGAALDPDHTAGAVLNIFARNLKSEATTQLSVASAGAPNGDSSLPSISDDGRFVSFITAATNVSTPAPASGSTSLVACDRGDPIGSSLQCITLYSTATGSTQALVTGERPRLSGDGTRIAFIRRTGQVGPTELRWAVIGDGTSLHAMTDAATPPNTTPQGNPVPVTGLPPSNPIFQESDAVLTEFGTEVVFVAQLNSGDERIYSVRIGTSVSGQERLDIDPAGGFLGDEAASFEVIHFDSLATNDFATIIEFRTIVVDNSPAFAQRRATTAAALSLPTSGTGVYVVRDFFPAPTSELVSRGNPTNANPDGAPVDALAGGLSRDGRFVGFTTSMTNAHDHADQPTVTQQLVVRDLTLDANRKAAGLERIPGALVTARDASISLAAGCTQAGGASCGGTITDISMDQNGSRVSFADTGRDLVPGDSGTSIDTFVRTWQPTLANGTADLGDVQAGDSTTASIPINVSGFGPLQVGDATISGDIDEFAVEGTTCFSFVTLYDGDSCAVSIRFAPDETLGPRQATVSIASEQYSEPQEVSTVQATVVPNALTHAPGDTARTSVRNSGAQSPDGGGESMISGNGRWQVFTSTSSLTGRPSEFVENVFVRDLVDPQHTVQISLHNAIGATPTDPSRPIAVSGNPRGISPDGDSFEPSISSDGRFVSFFTQASDIVPIAPLEFEEDPDYVLVVCDRDPSNTKDAAGNPILDLPRKGTQLPNYVCFPVQSGGFFVDSRGADTSSTPRVSGDGTRITWVEDEDSSLQRARVATLSTPGGKLHAPSDFEYVPSDVPGFHNESAADNARDAGTVDQVDPTLTENGDTVAYVAGECRSFSPCDSTAVIETDLVAGISLRFDNFDGGGWFDPPSVSDNGNEVAFAHGATGDDFSKVYVATRTGSTVSAPVLASINNKGAPSAGATPVLSGDGRYLAFQTGEPTEHNGVDPPGGGCFNGSNVFCQIVARDLVKDAQRAANSQPPLASEIVSSSISTDCVAKLPPGRVCAGDDSASNPSIDETGSEIGFDTTADDIVPGDTNEINIEGPEPAEDAFVHTWRPALSASPGFGFGTVQVGAHKDKTFKVIESGFGPISLGITSIAGTNLADFTLLSTTCSGRTLNDTQQCKLKIRFAPTVAGNRSASLALPVGKNDYPRHNPNNTISYDPALLGTLTGVGKVMVVRTGQLVADPSTLDFGKRLPLAPKLTKTVTLTDTGTGSLEITDISVHDTTHPGASGDYTLDTSGCPDILLPGESCAITVSFVGHAVGNRGAELEITDDTNGGTTTTIELVARVPKPKITANPGVSPPGRVTMISGAGFAPHRMVDIGLKGFGEHAEVRANGHGEFEVGMVIFRNTPEGPQLVTAQTRGKSKTISATGPLLLAVGSVDILDLVTRH